MTRTISHTIISYRPEQGANWMERALIGFAPLQNSERKQFDTRQDRCPKRWCDHTSSAANPARQGRVRCFLATTIRRRGSPQGL